MKSNLTASLFQRAMISGFLSGIHLYIVTVLLIYVYLIYLFVCPSLWPSGIGSRLGRNQVRFLAVSYIYPMFIEPTITWVPSGFSGYIWLDTKIVLKKKNWNFSELYFEPFGLIKLTILERVSRCAWFHRSLFLFSVFCIVNYRRHTSLDGQVAVRAQRGCPTDPRCL